MASQRDPTEKIARIEMQRLNRMDTPQFAERLQEGGFTSQPDGGWVSPELSACVPGVGKRGFGQEGVGQAVVT